MAFGRSATAVPEPEHPSEHVHTGTLAPAVGLTVARRGARSLPGVTQRGQRQVDASEDEDDAPHRPSVPRAPPSPRHARQYPCPRTRRSRGRRRAARARTVERSRCGGERWHSRVSSGGPGRRMPVAPASTTPRPPEVGEQSRGMRGRRASRWRSLLRLSRRRGARAQWRRLDGGVPLQSPRLRRSPLPRAFGDVAVDIAAFSYLPGLS
jgi:hypothetical protein